MKLPTTFLFSVCLAAACSTPSSEILPMEASADLGKADHLALVLTPVDASIGPDRRFRGGTAVITSADSWVEYMGTNAPADVDFSREWVAFYGLGTQSSGGFSAEILAIHNVPSLELLVLETESRSPGADCAVTKAITFPHTIVKFATPATVPMRATAEGHDEVYECGPIAEDECDVFTNDGCADGEFCRPGVCLLFCEVNDPNCCAPNTCEPTPLHGPCGDGTLPVCEILVEPCPDGLVRETVGGCFGQCVNPVSCLPPPGELCGDTVCGAGTECCNPLDGICVPPGLSCAF